MEPLVPLAPAALRLPPIHQGFTVAFDYPVCFTSDLFDTHNLLLRDTLAAESDGPARFLAVVDAGVVGGHPDLPAAVGRYARAHVDAVELVAPPLVVPGGEQVKNDPSLVWAVHEAINRGSICRHSFVLAIGGGAVLDMVGFAAATAHRGVRLVRVPTTVLAQNDSGVGVKNGVNGFGKKNFVGAFAPPVAVLNDLAFLTTLSDRDWRSGIAEAIKVALVKDGALFAALEVQAAALVSRDLEAMGWLIHRCAQLHLEHIATAGDPFELGSSRPLDLGHWAAHKLEQLSSYGLRHGEAVAVGLALDSTYARAIGLLPEPCWRRILDLLAAVRLPTYTRELGVRDRADPRCVLHGLAEFREHLGGRLTIMLPQDLGRGIEVHAIDEPAMLGSMACLEALQGVSHNGHLGGGL